MKVRLKGGGTAEMRAVWWEGGRIHMIDQRRLPGELKVCRISDVGTLCSSIRSMVVRGAPSIGAAAAYGMALGWASGSDPETTRDSLLSTRPTAHDLFYAVSRMGEVWSEGGDVVEASRMYVEDIIDRCVRIGRNGASLFRRGMRVLTHCNAGALATVDVGTALAPIRTAEKRALEPFVYVSETRPWFQGARLTAWELLNEGIGHAVIVDSASAYLMWRGEVDMVLVGADRVAANGDTANKIGTCAKALAARANDIPFYVAAPVSTFDPNISTGREMLIEERDPSEVERVGSEHITPEGTRCLNPAFDVTPHDLITGFITESGIFSPEEVGSIRPDDGRKG